MAKRMTKASLQHESVVPDHARSRRLRAIPAICCSVSPWWVFSFRPHDQVTNCTPGACESPAGVLKTG